MSLSGLAPPPPFLPVPGKPVVPWPQWKPHFTNFLMVSGGDQMSSVRRKAILLHALGVEGQRVFYTLPSLSGTVAQHAPASSSSDGTGTSVLTWSPDSEPDVYEIATRQLDLHYKLKVNIAVERHRFRRRTQQPGEDVNEYISALRSLAATCEFQDIENAICDQLVEGTTQHLRERRLYECTTGVSLTLDRAISICQHLEGTGDAVREFSSTSPVQHVTTREGKRKYAKDKSNTGKVTCYRCGRQGHLANAISCKARNATCKACGKKGHFQTVCRSKARGNDDHKITARNIERSQHPYGSRQSRKRNSYECAGSRSPSYVSRRHRIVRLASGTGCLLQEFQEQIHAVSHEGDIAKLLGDAH
ncbi:uncharacterized protein LOC135379180 [Ornithodoros turicata]|uniref:uncharacterized protein LOC135379180 n=1 Tax=Ornithodoros turicata TaxID=34597 RepID=UPI003138859F